MCYWGSEFILFGLQRSNYKVDILAERGVNPVALGAQRWILRAALACAKVCFWAGACVALARATSFWNILFVLLRWSVLSPVAAASETCRPSRQRSVGLQQNAAPCIKVAITSVMWPYTPTSIPAEQLYIRQKMKTGRVRMQARGPQPDRCSCYQVRLAATSQT